MKQRMFIEELVLFFMAISSSYCRILYTPDEFVGRCVRYGIPNNNCRSYVYYNTDEYKKFLTSFGSKILIDPTCDSGAACYVLVSRNPPEVIVSPENVHCVEGGNCVPLMLTGVTARSIKKIVTYRQAFPQYLPYHQGKAKILRPSGESKTTTVKGTGGISEDNVVTLVRQIDVTKTMETPITLYREAMETVTDRKILTNFIAVTTTRTIPVTKTSTESITKVETKTKTETRTKEGTVTQKTTDISTRKLTYTSTINENSTITITRTPLTTLLSSSVSTISITLTKTLDLAKKIEINDESDNVDREETRLDIGLPMMRRNGYALHKRLRERNNRNDSMKKKELSIGMTDERSFVNRCLMKGKVMVNGSCIVPLNVSDAEKSHMKRLSIHSFKATEASHVGDRSFSDGSHEVKKGSDDVVTVYNTIYKYKEGTSTRRNCKSVTRTTHQYEQQISC